MSSQKLRVMELCYVDCFSGPWGDESEKLSNTSIAISMRILAKCQQELRRRGISVRLRALYVEKDENAFARLQQYISEQTPEGIEACALHGDFVALRSAILDWCGTNAFTFFFIDPKGWKEVRIDVLRPLLQRPRSEFLINFMYDFVNRTASMAEWKDDMAELLGEPIDVEGLPAPERERRLLGTYRRNLKGSVNSAGKWLPRAAYVRVLDPAKERPKYHLVYLTTHPRGIIEFMQISEAIDQIQKQVRASTRTSARAAKFGMDDLFGPDTFVNAREGHASPNDVEEYWLTYLAGGIRKVGEAAFAEILEETDWFPGDLQSALGNLINAGKVRNLDSLRKRPKKPLHWDKEESLNLTEKVK